MILDILPPTSESLSRQVGLLKDPRTRCTKLVAWDAQVSIFLSWPVTLCSQRLYTKLSFKNSLPHCDQYNNSLHPSSIHVASRGPDSRLATSQLAKGLRSLQKDWVTRKLSLDSGSIFTDWIRVASLWSLTDASSSQGRRDSSSALSLCSCSVQPKIITGPFTRGNNKLGLSLGLPK